jgi:hypothetical protein
MRNRQRATAHAMICAQSTPGRLRMSAAPTITHDARRRADFAVGVNATARER